MSPKLSFNKGDFVQIVLPNGNYRFGYISEIADMGMTVAVQFYEEGANKIGFEEAMNTKAGNPPEDWASFLTYKEKEIVPLLAAGLSSKNIAERLCCTESTIRAQVRSLRIKLQLENKVQLVCYCEGLLKKLNGNLTANKT